MAFSLKKILSNMNYFKKPEDQGMDPSLDSSGKKRRHSSTKSGENSCDTSQIALEPTEADSTSIPCTSFEHFTAEKPKESHSDTDLLSIKSETTKLKRRSKKLKLDIQRANKSLSEGLDVVNTPKHISLGCKSSAAFSERIKDFDFTKSFDIFDALSDEISDEEGKYDIESLSERSDSESIESEKGEIQMCRKIDPIHQSQLSIEAMLRSTTPESFSDVELDKTEDDRITLLLSYQMKLEKMEHILKKLLTEFQFHIEVSKVFQSKSVMTTLPGANVKNVPKILGLITHMDNLSRGPSPTGSWNIVMEKEDTLTKIKLKQQLLSMKHYIEEFVNVYLQNQDRVTEQKCTLDFSTKTRKPLNQRSLTFDVPREKTKHLKVSNKKKYKRHNDFPDLKEALHNLFMEHQDTPISEINEENDKCVCNCRFHQNPSETDSGLTSNMDQDNLITSHSITSSIGNFSLDTSALTAYSESLDQIISYNSFQDTSLYSTLLQKTAVDRITFYVQVHSIELKSQENDFDHESKNTIIFFCLACKHTETEERGVLRHILDKKHCEKIHFLYKTAYIKKCLSLGKEIQPSTVLNPMTMYRDDNKIVCFGDANYACSLCFETQIVGESVLMAHCYDEQHVERREMLSEIFEVE